MGLDMSGWYAMKRGWLDHEIFSPVGQWSRAEVWVWMIENAAFKPTVIDIGGKPYTVQRGALCYSERFLSVKFKWSRKALTTFIAQLEAHGVVKRSIASTGAGMKSKRSQITLCNYERYQPSGTKTEPKGSQKGAKEEQGNKETSVPVGDAAASAPIEVSVVSSAVWNAGKPFLASRGVDDPGAMIGRWLKDHPPLAVLGAIEAAQKVGTQDPIPYITEVLKGGPNAKTASKSARRVAAFLAGARGPS